MVINPKKRRLCAAGQFQAQISPKQATTLFFQKKNTFAITPFGTTPFDEITFTFGASQCDSLKDQAFFKHSVFFFFDDS